MRVFRKQSPDVRMLFAYSLFVVLFIGVSIFCAVGCEAKKKVTLQSGEETDPTAATQFSGEVTETTTESNPSPTTPTKVPVEENPEYTFDLTDDELVFETENRLSYFSSCEEIVILGGPIGLYRLDAGDVTLDGGCYFNDDYIQMYLFSLNRDRIAFLSDYFEGELWDPSFNGHGTLMYYDGTGSVKISEDVCAFDLSDDGTGVAYLMASDTPENGSELHVYNTETKEFILISASASDGFVFSPDGNTIAYREYTDPGNTTELRCYYQVIGGEPIAVKTGVTPVALTNLGDTIYYCTDSSFSVQSGNKTRLLCSDSDFEEGVIFNRDHSQVLFPDNSGLYFSQNGGKPIEFSTGTPIILQRESFHYYNSIYNLEYYRSVFLENESMSINIINKKNLCNLLIQGEDNLFYFDENLKEQTLEQRGGWYGNYVGNGLGVLCWGTDPETGLTIHVYLSNFTDPDCVPLILGDEYVQNTDIAASGAIFYDNDIGQLFRVDPDGSETLVDTYASMVGCAEYDGITYVYYSRLPIEGRGIRGGSLYCKEESADIKTEPVLIDDSERVSVHETNAGIIFENNSRALSNDDSWDLLYDLNRSFDGTHFSAFMTMMWVDLS